MTDVNIVIDIAITAASQTIPQPQYPPFWRVKHDAEMGPLWRTGVPEVFIMLPVTATEFHKDWQLLSYTLNTIRNPIITADMTKKKWRALYDYERAFTNGTGFGDPSDPRADWVNNININKPNPRFDKPRLCGGATVTGIIDGNDLIVKTMNVNSVPSIEWLLARPWLYFDAVTVTKNGIGRFPQGTNGNRVFVPLVTSKEVRYPLDKLEKLPANSPPADPYQLSIDQ